MNHELKFMVNDIKAPFDFDISTRLYSSYKFPELIDVVKEGKYYRVLNINQKLILLIMESEGTIDKPLISVTMHSDSPLDEEDINYAKERINWMFGLDEDLIPFYEFIKEHDPMLYKFIQKLYGLRAPATPTVFEAFVHVIVEQQISFDFAGATKAKIVEKYGNKMLYHGSPYYAFPTPERLAQAEVMDLRELKTSTRKAEYIIDVAKGITENTLDFESFITLSDAEVIESMSKIRGVGVWTSEMSMVRGMRKLSALPADDIALRSLFTNYYCDGRKIESEEAREIAEKHWGEYRGYASFYLMYGGRILHFEK